MEPGGIAALMSGSGVLTSVVTWLLTRRRNNDSDARADWAKFTGEMRLALASERKAAVEAARRIDDMRERLERGDLRYRSAADHIDVLEAHIWGEKPPPPPARPEGI